MNRKWRETALPLLLIIVGALGGWVAVNFTAQTLPSRTVEWLDYSRVIESFSLSTADGAFTEQNLLGQWHIVLFGYSHCPDICPTSLSEIDALVRQMPIEQRIPVLFVSVDAQRDSPAQLARYVSFFNPDFVGVTGTPQSLTPLTESLGIRFVIGDDLQQPEIAHSLTISLVDPDGRLRGRLRPGFNTEATAAEITRVVQGKT